MRVCFWTYDQGWEKKTYCAQVFKKEKKVYLLLYLG